MHRRGMSASAWYLAAVVLSGLGVGFAVASHLRLRVGYPLAFIFTMFGLFAITRPSWDQPERRLQVVAVSSGAFLTQLAVLYGDLLRSASS